MATLSTSEQLRRAQAVEAGGAATESMGGVAVLVLAIIALAGVLRTVLTDIAGIIFGAAFIVEGAALAARHSAIMNQVAEDEVAPTGSEGGMTVEFVVGLTAVVLGILSLVGVAPAILMPALVIVGGAGLILSAGVVARFTQLRSAVFGAGPAGQAISGTAMSSALSSATAGQLLAGLASVILGILALVGVGDGQVLTTTGLLVLGAAITLSGTALSGMMLSVFRPRG